jgi:hypothetical protein
MADITNFFKSLNKTKTTTYNKNNDLFTIPKSDKFEDIPKIKNNITQENYLHQADLLFLPTSQFGFKYAFVIVDVATSKCDAVALKTKTPNDIINGIKTIYNKHKILKEPYILQFDSGTEFKNKDVKNYLKDLKISVRFILPNRHRQNSVVESRNKYLGHLILKYLALKELDTGKKSTAWHNNLDKYIEFMNSKLMQPKPINMFADIAGRKDNIEILEINQKVRKILDYPINAYDNKKVDSKFRTGDMRFSKDIYKIKHIILNPNMPPLYMLNKIDNDEILDNTVAYTTNQLLKVK